MDLKNWNRRWILHIVDLWSCFTVSTFIPRKRLTDVIHAMMTEWCSIFGIPQGVLTDNGGQFVSEEMLEVESMLNTEVLSTAAESPFQNGVRERNHQVVDSILTHHKLVQDFPCTLVDILLKWSCMANNSLQINEGFSSHQLALGKNPNIPNAISLSPSSLEASTTCAKFAKRINSLHAAPKAFIESTEIHYPGDTLVDKLSDGNDISSNTATTSTDNLDSSGNLTNGSGKQSVLEERVPEGDDDQVNQAQTKHELKQQTHKYHTGFIDELSFN